MSNEELVKLVQDGQKEYIPQLWDQVYLFICSMAKRRLGGVEYYLGQLEDDMVNESYFDFLKAIDNYEQEQGAFFITYLKYYIQNGFNRALGLRTDKDKKNLMHRAFSLDKPVDDEGDFTLQDMIVDNMAEERYRFIENEDFWRDVHELLEDAILTVTSGMIQEVFLTMLHKNCIFSKACQHIGVLEDERDSMKSMYSQGLRKIGHYITVKERKQCKKIGIDEYFSLGLHGSGLSSWRCHAFTSSTERAAIRLVDQELWYKEIVKMFG